MEKYKLELDVFDDSEEEFDFEDFVIFIEEFIKTKKQKSINQNLLTAS